MAPRIVADYSEIVHPSLAHLHHRPWPLQRAEAVIRRNEMLKPHGVLLPDIKPLLHFAKRLEVIVWAPVWVS